MSFFDVPFWQACLSGMCVTLIGVVIGIPIALGVGRYLETYAEKERKQRNSLAEKERKRRILLALNDELVANREHIFKWLQSDDQQMMTGHLYGLLQDETWKAFSDRGELQWIKDPVLLNSLSSAYFATRSLRELSQKYFEAIVLERVDFSSTSAIDLHSEIGKAIINFSELANRAINDIKNNLE